MFELKNKVALVTGSARGIGAEIAVLLAKQGADVIVVDIIDGKDTAEKIKKLNRRAVYIGVDVSDKDSVVNMIAQAVSKFKKIDIVVNNAGVYIGGNSETFFDEDWKKTIDVNLTGYFLVCKEAFRYLKKTKGNIVNIASIAGLSGFRQSAAYCSSKGGIILLTKSLAADWGKYGIRVNAICPGLIRTAMSKTMLENKKMKEKIISKLAIPRIGIPEDIANGVVYLSSDEAGYVTGQYLIIDGGWSCSL